MGNSQAKPPASMTLYYFDIKGKGEPIRLAAKFASFPLKDERIDRDTFQAMKAKGELKFGQLPIAKFFDKDGQEVFTTAQV